jgi:hypothetical protein
MQLSDEMKENVLWFCIVVAAIFVAALTLR